jgi:hypothetical protein
MKKTLLFLSVFLLVSGVARAGGGWKGEIPEQARDSGHWQQLAESLRRSRMPYGEMAVAARMLTFFSDLATKEQAYRRVVQLMDRGTRFH